MNAQTIPSTDNTNGPLFLGPETHQRAGRGGDEANFSGLLQEVLTRPGVVNEAYRAFHSYSIGNQILAAIQLADRGLPLAPIASFNAREKGRFVRKGRKGSAPRDARQRQAPGGAERRGGRAAPSCSAGAPAVSYGV